MGSKGSYKNTVIDNKKLLSEWDTKRNAQNGFAPETTSLSSKQKVYWICSEGHEWSASVLSRSNKGSGCPKCAIAARAKVRREATITAQGSLEDRFPEIASEWHPTKNGELHPNQFAAGSNDKVWWQCKQCGKEWRTGIGARTRGTGCPSCSKLEGGKKHREYTIRTQGSLKDNYPEIALEWHPTKNGEMLPEQYASGSSEKVWWLCKECGTEWETKISNRTRGHGCPSCKNEKFAASYRKKVLANADSFADMFPQMAAEWHPTKNSDLDPWLISEKSNHKFWWKCSEGHEWRTSVKERVGHKTGCPYCYQERRIRK